MLASAGVPRAAELLAVNNNKKFRPDHGVRRSAHAARGAVFARLEDATRRNLHHAIEEIEAQLSWQPPRVYTFSLPAFALHSFEDAMAS